MSKASIERFKGKPPAYIDAMKVIGEERHFLVMWSGAAGPRWVPESVVVPDDGELCMPIVDFYRRATSNQQRAMATQIY